MTRINPYKKFNGIHIPEGITKIPISKLSHGAKICYGRLARYAGADGICFPRIKTLAEEIGVKRRAVDSYIKELKDFGLIEAQRRGLNKSNKYYFLDHNVLYDALTNALVNAETNMAVAQDGTNNKESHIQDSHNKEGQLKYNPDGLSIKSISIPENDLGARDKLENDIKELIHVYKYKISRSYLPQITAETTGLIRSALEIFTKEQLIDGMDKYSNSPWWMEKTAQYE